MKGKLLISEPFMVDAHFKRSVVYIVEHDDEGTIGFVLNKPLDVKMQHVVRDFPHIDTTVGYGGPVGEDTLHFVHNVGDILMNSIPVSESLCWSGDFDQLQDLIREGAVTPDNVLFFIGYSGWDVGQLDDELKRGAWIVAEASDNQIIKGNYEDFWKDVLKPMGTNYDIISQMPDSPNYN